jgi:hypothetical protein
MACFESLSALPLRGEQELPKFDLRMYARQGAQVRASELESELAAIYRAFPDLGASREGRGQTRTVGARRRRQTAMSAAQRKAVSARMKKYWAERRRQKAAK